LTVRSRNGHDITTAVPELAPMAEQLAGRSVVLDGELVARQGRPWDFYGLGAGLEHGPPSPPRVAGREPL
jgi:ATP-dependent DNA ligase